MQPEYEVFALRYGTREARRHEHFIGGDPHDGPMPMDYFVWLAKNADRAVVIDIGFTAESGGKRGRALLRDPIDSPTLLGVSATDVQDVILTHMHYDHVGNFHKFQPPASISRNPRCTTPSVVTCATGNWRKALNRTTYAA
jgi:glyoxylase-like metal-dependent hydrolase (beta-lactamase superfamily II)